MKICVVGIGIVGKEVKRWFKDALTYDTEKQSDPWDKCSQEKYPDKIFMFNPEFLTEITAEKDFSNPDMQILGVPHQGYEIATEVLSLLPPAPIMSIVSPIDAEWIKKLRNAFYATKVIFFNEIYDIIKASKADYETIRSIVIKDKSVGNSHSMVFHKGYRGYGGTCLPKDFNSLIGFAKNIGVETKLLDTVKEINESYGK